MLSSQVIAGTWPELVITISGTMVPRSVPIRSEESEYADSSARQLVIEVNSLATGLVQLTPGAPGSSP